MYADAFQARVVNFMDPKTSTWLRTINWTLGLTGEAGEVTELIKKHYFHNKELSRLELAKELGDVLWYTTALAHQFRISLADIMRLNVRKLAQRYPDRYPKQPA